ncbi:MAG: T9SS C-terminal target domain-containing protein [Ignavibacteria bacterium]|nr:MAG: T9SS C-terminal target domain-containing protein [Ignavibacteria bacterium]
MSERIKYIFYTLFLLIHISTLISAQDGQFDSTFSNDGYTTTDLLGEDEIKKVLIQSDGKILTAGNSINISSTNFIYLARYNSDGSLDNTFDSDGIVQTHFRSSGEYCNDIALLSDGKILLVGYTFFSGTSYDIILLRYNSDGSLDATFDSDGKVFTSLSSGDDRGNSIAIQSDGKILVGGLYNGSDFVIVRYNSDGSLDTTFDTDGYVTTDFQAQQDEVSKVLLQNDGNVVAIGTVRTSSGKDIGLARYNTNGSLDTSFDSDGKVSTDFSGGFDYGTSGALQSDGKIVVVGTASISGNDLCLLRYNSNGSLDTSFDSDGKAIFNIDFRINYGKDVAVLSDGKILALALTSGGDLYINLLRLNSDGSKDLTFGTDGQQDIDFFGDDRANSLAVQSDGKIVIGGKTNINNNFFVARLKGSSAALPVELTNFKAIREGNYIRLLWETATEIDNYGFEVERKIVQEEEWETIAFIPGSGNSYSPKDYNYLDKNSIEGQLQYRLKQLNTDGTFSYSKTIEIYTQPFKLQLINNYPNPFNPTTIIKWQTDVPGYQSVIVYDALGRKIKELFNGFKPVGKHKIEFDASKLAGGIYFYSLHMGGKSITKKMLLLK